MRFEQVILTRSGERLKLVMALRVGQKVEKAGWFPWGKTADMLCGAISLNGRMVKKQALRYLSFGRAVLLIP